MKTVTLMSLFLAVTATAAPIEITCGNTQAGAAVVFSISPLQQVFRFKTYLDGALTDSTAFGPTHGIYDKAHVTFSGRDFLHSDIFVHASYARVLRINHYSAATISFKKEHNDTDYKLAQFSSGQTIAEDSMDELKEERHEAYIGLPCTIIGL